jgi:hypothetical protein
MAGVAVLDPASAQRSSNPTTQATRYLCAAAYSDHRFARWVISDLLEGHNRAAAPSYGVDIVPIIRHCVRAQRQRLVRDLVLSAMLIATALMVVNTARPLLEIMLRPVLLSWAVVFFMACLIRYEVVVPRLLRDRFNPDRGPRMSGRRERLLYDLVQRLRTNVTVYSGFSPFVGCGLDIGGWSFVVDTRRGREDPIRGTLEPKTFNLDELYSCTTQRVHDLRLDRLRTESRLFVNGRDARAQRWLLHDPASRPSTWVDDAVVDHFRRFPSEQVRHYLTVQVVEWGGELVLSIFLRFSVTGDNLFCEASYFLLPPVVERYHQVDDMNGEVDLRTVGAIFLRSIVLTPFLLVIAPFAVLYRIVERWTRWRERVVTRRRARQCPTFDYGAVTTVRQRSMSPNPRHYFQLLDRIMYVKLVEQQIFDAIITFLEKSDIDTSELRKRQTTVLNTGVIVSGGQINAESLAVGTGAVAGVRHAVSAARSGGASGAAQPSSTSKSN